METIWRVPDDLWEEDVKPTIDELDPPSVSGRPRIDARAAFNGIIHHMRTGCQWSALPREFGDDSSVHRTFQRWIACGVIVRIWARIVERCEELCGVDWRWQAADTAMGKARLGGIRSAPIPRIVRRMAASAA